MKDKLKLPIIIILFTIVIILITITVVSYIPGKYQHLRTVILNRNNNRIMHSYIGFQRIITPVFSRYYYIEIVEETGVKVKVKVERLTFYFIQDKMDVIEID